MIVISGVRLSTPTRRETNLEMDFAKTFTTLTGYLPVRWQKRAPLKRFDHCRHLAAADFISALT
jgi:hypothetical protein